MSFIIGIVIGFILGAFSVSKNLNQLTRKCLGLLGQEVKHKARQPRENQAHRSLAPQQEPNRFQFQRQPPS